MHSRGGRFELIFGGYEQKFGALKAKTPHRESEGFKLPDTVNLHFRLYDDLKFTLFSS